MEKIPSESEVIHRKWNDNWRQEHDTNTRPPPPTHTHIGMGKSLSMWRRNKMKVSAAVNSAWFTTFATLHLAFLIAMKRKRQIMYEKLFGVFISINIFL